MTDTAPAPQFAIDWLRLIIDGGDVEAAWPLTERNLRLCLVQQLMTDNPDAVGSRDFDEMSTRLSQEHPVDDSWPAMQQGLLRMLRLKWQRPWVVDLEAVDLEVLDLDVVLVTVADRQEEPTAGLVSESPLRMSLSDGRWLVSGFSEQAPEPGRPPTF